MHNFFLWTFLFLRFFPLIFFYLEGWDGDNNLKRMFGWNNNNNTRVFSFHSFIVVSRHFLSREGIQFLYIFRYIYIWFNNNRNFNLQYSLELCSCFLFFFSLPFSSRTTAHVPSLKFCFLSNRVLFHLLVFNQSVYL